MPNLNSNDVLDIVRDLSIGVPIIIVSGMIPEATAVAAMHAGAQDYIMKDNMARLIPAIERELNEAKARAEKLRAEEELYFMAKHDALTNLVNRTELEGRLQTAIDLSNQYGQNHVFLYIDLDQFKIINDTSGHVAGDECIKQIANKLKHQIRETDTLARLGGDEFGVLLENCPYKYAVDIAENLLRVVSDFRFAWQEKQYRLSASIGFVEIGQLHANSVEEILSAADVACYAAKDQGRNRIKEFRKYDHDLLQRFGEMQWVSRINRALEANEFFLYQQQIFPTRRQSKVYPQRWEFLLRMYSDDGKVMLPSAFIPAAERYSLMPQIDRWVIDTAFNNISQLNNSKQHKEYVETYFINLSGASLSDGALYDYILDKLHEYQIQPRKICFEVTETAAIDRLNDAVNFINHIKSTGCLFALDDFGAGMSSFTYLKTIPVDFIKIDGSFVAQMIEQPMDCAIVEAINNIGHIAGMQTIAEYVEDNFILEKLNQLGVDYVQGFGLERPVPVQHHFRAMQSVN